MYIYTHIYIYIGAYLLARVNSRAAQGVLAENFQINMKYCSIE